MQRPDDETLEYFDSDEEGGERPIDVSQLFCMVCGGGDDEPNMLICDGKTYSLCGQRFAICSACQHLTSLVCSHLLTVLKPALVSLLRLRRGLPHILCQHGHDPPRGLVLSGLLCIDSADRWKAERRASLWSVTGQYSAQPFTGSHQPQIRAPAKVSPVAGSARRWAAACCRADRRR